MAFLLGLVMVTGCGEKAEKAAKQVGDKTQAATAVAKETMESAADWTQDKMNAYVGEMSEQMSKFGKQFEDLSAKAESLGDDAKQSFNTQFAALTEKETAVSNKMEELQNASGDAWVRIKAELDGLMAELAELYESIKKEFNIS
jgi:hypothetical protein